jgi:hypothetical protein
MGYMLSSLGKLPIEEDVEFYIFVINGGWRGGPTEIISQNFERIARDIGPQTVIAKGFEEPFWSDEICEKYLGKKHTALFSFLPALLITDSHPERLKPESMRLLIPLREVKNRFGTFDQFFSSLIRFVRHKDTEFLERFEDGTNMSDEALKIVELKPNFFGIGVNLNRLIKKFMNRSKKFGGNIS